MTPPGNSGDAEPDRRVELREDAVPSQAVIAAVAAVRDRPPMELEPLAGRIDPDGLDLLIDGARRTGTTVEVAFEYAGCRVVVTPMEIWVFE